MKDSHTASTVLNRNIGTHPEVQWVVETNSVLLIHRESRQSLELKYPEAAVWDLLTQGYDRVRMKPLISRIMTWDEAKTEKQIEAILNKLLEAEFIKFSN